MAVVARPTISAVLPAYNEEANLERTVRDLLPVLARAAGAYEIIVVDDGSADGTATIAARLSTEIPSLRLVRHDHNEGYGAALRSGFSAATQEWILLLDADGQFLPQELDRFLAAIPPAHLVIGYRRERADPPHRRFFAAAWRVLTGFLLGVRVRDTNCGFKLMRATIVQSLNLQAGGALISAELLAKARRLGAVIVEVPVTHAPRRYGTQTGGSLRIVLRAYYELARLGWRIRRFKG